MKEVNMTVGRFQPFTKGHLQMLLDGKEKNGLPVVVLIVKNTKFDSRHPFSDELTLKELDIVKKNYPGLIEDTFFVSKANIVECGEVLRDNGYQAQLWLCGEDNIKNYKAMVSTPKYIEQGGYPEGFDIYTGTGRVEGVSGTAAREALKAGDKKAFKAIMPKGTDKLFDKFVEEISKINEEDEIQGLSDFVIEAISSGAYTKTKKKSNRDQFIATDRNDLWREIGRCIAEDGYQCDLNHIDVSQIRDFSDLFYNFSDFDGDISDWNMKNAENTRNMFYSSKYTGQNGDISDWEVDNVRFAGRMFYGSKYDGDISRWNLKSLDVRNSVQMIANCPLAKNRKHWPKRFR